MYLFILNGQDDGKRIDLSPGTYSIGRSTEASIQLALDRYISGIHAKIDFTEDLRLFITDNGSRNGTFILGEPVKEKTEILPGEIFQLGKTFLKFTRRSKERYSVDEQHSEARTEAIVVIDIVGSSKIANVLGNSAASKVINYLKDILKKKVAKYPAEYIKNTGDGFMVIFSKALTAVMLSKELIEELNSGENTGFHVRIGINYGETFVLEDGDRRGISVDMAFRIESVKSQEMHQTVSGIKKEDLPRADRIFISETVQKLLGTNQSFNTRCIGYFDLKGFNGRHKIFEILP